MANRKIMVIDDEVDFLEIIKTRLAAGKYSVVTYFNTQDILENIKRERPDAVLLDIMMPGVDGIDILRDIRSQNKTLPVFIMTAYANEERLKAASELGASGFIIKTDDLQKEMKKISAVLDVAEKFKK